MSTAANEKELIIRPPTRWAALNIAEVWQYRDLLTSLARRDVTLRYRQTALGVIWVILQPLMTALIFGYVFGSVAGMDSPIKPYWVFSYAGLLAWNLFNTILTRTSICLVQNAQLVTKVYFPRLTLPISTIFAAFIDFGVAFALLLVLMPILHINPGFAILMLPVWTLIVVTMAMGIGLYISALMVSYRDVQFVLPVVMSALFFATPAAYAAPTSAAKRLFFEINPLTGVMDAFRWSLLGVESPSVAQLIYSAVFAAVVFVIGAFEFKRMEKKFADVI